MAQYIMPRVYITAKNVVHTKYVPCEVKKRMVESPTSCPRVL